MVTETLREDTVAPRRGPPPIKKSCHWWSERIAELRRNATRVGRNWKRKKRSARASEEELEEIRNEYRKAKRELRKEIRHAKTESWKDLIATIERDPWGLPYKMVLRKRY